MLRNECRRREFGNGNVTAIEGSKLTIQFDRAGEKRVVDFFVHGYEASFALIPGACEFIRFMQFWPSQVIDFDSRQDC